MVLHIVPMDRAAGILGAARTRPRTGMITSPAPPPATDEMVKAAQERQNSSRKTIMIRGSFPQDRLAGKSGPVLAKPFYMRLFLNMLSNHVRPFDLGGGQMP
ncbi:hypothetical protein AA102526_0656 [Asaia lannensis NBRC 102526]|nr:hypothetical protein AA102526_0656 [Asaia lannensis NBRC 102526]